METKHTAESVGNAFGYLCPKCKKGDALYISFVGTCLLTTDGSDDEGDHEWSDDSTAVCRHCVWIGTVSQLTEVEIEE